MCVCVCVCVGRGGDQAKPKHDMTGVCMCWPGKTQLVELLRDGTKVQDIAWDPIFDYDNPVAHRYSIHCSCSAHDDDDDDDRDDNENGNNDDVDEGDYGHDDGGGGVVVVGVVEEH